MDNFGGARDIANSANVANGGLILEAGGRLYITGARGDSGTFVIDPETGSGFKAGGSYWFMSARDGDVFCSDRQRGGALVKLNAGTLEAETILDAPCYGVTLSGGWLIYIDERDGRLYRCLPDGAGHTRMSDERTVCFAAADDKVFYATNNGIWMCGSGREKAERIAECAAAHMIIAGNMLAFADRARDYELTLLNPAGGETIRFGGLSSAGLNSDGRYLYCVNRSNDRTVYRIDPVQRRSIRICGERADYLHVIDDRLYFFGRDDWYRMSLHGGQPEKVAI